MTEALGSPDGDSGAGGAAGHRAGAKAAEAPAETEALAPRGSALPRGGREGKPPRGPAELPGAQLATGGGLPRPPRRVTSWDVAREAGVSQNTVSLILKGSPRISAATRARVQGVMERLGYRPNAVAAALRSGTTRAVLFVAPRGASRHHLTSELVAGVTDEAATEGFCVVLRPVQEAEEALADLYRAQMVAAAVVFPRGIDDPAAEALVGAGCPTVAVLGPCRGLGAERLVVADDAGGAAAAVWHLVRRGHRRIGVVAPPGPPWGIGAVRVRGAQEAARAAGVQLVEVEAVDWGVADGLAAAQRLLADSCPPSAVFAISDRLAYGVLHAAADRGLQVPADLAVVGFDNAEWSQYTRPPLTTVEFPVYAMGRQAVRRLLHPEEPPPWERAPARLVERASS